MALENSRIIFSEIRTFINEYNKYFSKIKYGPYLFTIR